MRSLLISLGALAVIPPVGIGAVPMGTHGRYAVLTCKPRTAAPFATADFVYGPTEAVDGVPFRWWQLEVREKDDEKAQPMFQLQALTARDPLVRSAEPLRFHRYLLRIPETGEVLEYRNVHTDRALLPIWTDFEKHFVPVPVRGSGAQEGVPETCSLLGHVLMLRHVGHNVPFQRFENAKMLNLDRELLVGTSRNFKDKEGHRLPQKPERQNYTYIPFVAEDYPVMIEAGINLYIVSPEQELFVRDEPVFYIRGIGGKSPMKWPADFYRSNYHGPEMFMDEPSIIMVGDELIHKTLRYFSDAAAVIERRVREGYTPDSPARALEGLKVNLGDLRLQYEYPTWETLYETAFYQMRGGVAGIVHEGRYQLEEFDKAVAPYLKPPRQHTAEQMLRWYYAILRGGTRPFGRYWGTAIYGQCDPKIAPEAMKIAYDMGARCLWFWTSDHDHHMPWPEQLELARALKAHAAEHPRPSIASPPPVRDLAVAIPDGYFLSLENLWWVRVLDPKGQNEASARYRRLMRRAFREIEAAFDRGEDFDVTIDDGREITGYRRVVRITDEERG